MAYDDYSKRPRPVLGFAIIAVAAIALVSFAGYNWYNDEYLDDDDKNEYEAPVRSYADLTINFKGKNTTVVMEIYEDKAPRTAANFRHYVRTNFYDETVFHRVITDFVVQGGGVGVDGEQKTPDRDPVEHEDTGLRNNLGMVSMARLESPDSATSQFFFNIQDNPSLNPGGVDAKGYVVFARVIEGFPLIQQIAKVATDDQDQPVEDVVLWKVKMQ